MNKSNKNIDKLVSEILKEEIEINSKKLSEQILLGPQDEPTPGEYRGDEEEDEEAEELSDQEPTYVGKGIGKNPWNVSRKPKMIGSFDDEHGWFDDIDTQSHGDAFDDYDEEEFNDFSSLIGKHGPDSQKWFAPDDGEKFFNRYKEKFGGKPFRVRTPKSFDEQEQEEGNAFSGALERAKKHHSKNFELDGETYPVKEGKDQKWIQKAVKHPGALHKKLGIPEGDKIPKTKLNSLKKELHLKSKGDKKLSSADSKLLKQVNLALNLKDINESKGSLRLTEDELIDMIEKIIKEQQVADKAEKDTFQMKKPEGLKKTIKVLDKNKTENDDYAKELTKKLTTYLKDGTKGKFETNPTDFPKSNHEIDKEDQIKKYTPSEAVDEYIEAFSYPGMTNLVYDEIKPDDKRIEKNLKGHSTTGNAEVDEEGKPLGNVVPSKTGERFYKNFKDNLYGAEQMNASYKRFPQPVDVEGETKESGTLKSKKSAVQKAQNVLNKVSESEVKKNKVINEDMEKMKNLISYNRKTQ